MFKDNKLLSKLQQIIKIINEVVSDINNNFNNLSLFSHTIKLDINESQNIIIIYKNNSQVTGEIRININKEILITKLIEILNKIYLINNNIKIILNINNINYFLNYRQKI